MEETVLIDYDDLSSYFTADIERMYINEVRAYPLLSKKEERELVARYREGDLSARDRLVECNLRLVLYVIREKNYRTVHLKFLDLVQEGNLGLMRAVETYDPELGAFSTYACLWIEQKIERSMDNIEREVRIPVNKNPLIGAYFKILNEAERMHKPTPSDDEVAEMLHITKTTLKDLKMAAHSSVMSANENFTGGDEDGELLDVLGACDDSYDEIENSMNTHDLLALFKNILSNYQYYVLFFRVFSPKKVSLETLAKDTGMTRENIRQAERKVLRRAKGYMAKDGSIYTETLKTIKKREGNRYEKLNTDPITPSKIVKFAYIKGDLSPIEENVLRGLLFPKYNLSIEENAEELGLKVEEFVHIRRVVEEKMREKLKDRAKYDRFRSMFLKTHQSNIFDMVNSDKTVIDYTKLDAYNHMTYESIIDLATSIGCLLSVDERARLKRCLEKYPPQRLQVHEIEKDVNIAKFGYKFKSSSLPYQTMKKTYEANKDKFPIEHREFLDNIFDNGLSISSLSGRLEFLLEKLEKIYFHLWNYFENALTRKEYLIARERYAPIIGEDRIRLLDLFYGVGTDAKSYSDLMGLMHIDSYDKMQDTVEKAKDFVKSVYKGYAKEKHIDKSIYAPFILNRMYVFPDDMREALRLFVIENLSRDEISKALGLSKVKVANMILDGLRKIDYYRFGVIETLSISKSEIEAVFANSTSTFSPIEKTIIYKKFLDYKDTPEIALEVGLDKRKVTKVGTRFKEAYMDYILRDVDMDEADIIRELKTQKSESVLTEELRAFASFYIGLKNEYNEDGVKLSRRDAMQKFGMTIDVYNARLKEMSIKIRGRKKGVVKPELAIISRDELKLLLADAHLPIDDKEKMVIKHLFELDGYPYKSLEELGSEEGMPKNVKRLYFRAVIEVAKYRNKEIDGIYDYETDIVPILKYFPLQEREFIISVYRDKLTYEEVGAKYGFTYYQVSNNFERLKSNIFDLLNDEDANRFDFDYYLKVVDEEDLPFYGDREVTKRAFDLCFGMNGGERLTFNEIVDVLKLDCSSQTVSRAVYSLMCAVCKYKMGIRASKTFSRDEVFSYYLSHNREMPLSTRMRYERYLASSNNMIVCYGGRQMNRNIIYDLIKEKYDDLFRIRTASKEEVIDIIKKYGKDILRSTRRALMSAFEITEREFMNGNELNRLYRTFERIERKRLECGAKEFSLKPKDQ